MVPLVGRLALVSSLTCSLGAIACPSQPADTTPAAAPEQPRETPMPAARQHDEQTAPTTPTSEPQSLPEPAPTTPTSESQPEPTNALADAPAVEPSRKLEVVARLVEVKPAGTCFMGHHLLPQTLLRYEIVDVLEGTYGERELYVVPRCSGTVWRCRNLTGKAVTRFTAGDTHHLRLEQERREWLVELPAAAKHLPPYRVTCGNLVPPESPTTPTSASQAEPPPPAPASAPADPTSAPAVEPSRELEVVARLLEPNRATDCVGMHTRPLDVVMRYEIIQVVQGTYSAREVYAGHRCPRGGTVACEGVAGVAVKKFMAGDVHHLRLDQNLERRGWRVDLRTDKHLRRYHVACGNLVPPESP